MNTTYTSWTDYWAEARKTGITLFILKRGTALGLLMFGMLVMAPRIFKMVETSDFPVVPLILFMLLGYVLGGLLWWANERSYDKQLALLAQETQEQPPTPTPKPTPIPSSQDDSTSDKDHD